MLNKTNELIIRLWNSGEFDAWNEVARVVNRKFGTSHSGQACRGRYRRHKDKFNRTPQLQSEPEPDAAVHSYQLDIPIEGAYNILVIGDLHEPFAHPDYFDFCVDVRDRYECDTTIFIGDVVDEHALSFWDSDPDGYSAGHEATRAHNALKKWYDEFPDAYVCIGNHDSRPFRRAFKTGIPKRYIRSFEEIWQSPPGWQWGLSFVSHGITYEHGVTTGIHAVYNRARKTRRSIVQGHSHVMPGVKYLAQDWWGMNVGCGIDESTYAMVYGRQYSGNIVLGCGVVLDAGQQPIFIPVSID